MNSTDFASISIESSINPFKPKPPREVINGWDIPLWRIVPIVIGGAPVKFLLDLFCVGR